MPPKRFKVTEREIQHVIASVKEERTLNDLHVNYGEVKDWKLSIKSITCDEYYFDYIKSINANVPVIGTVYSNGELVGYLCYFIGINNIFNIRNSIKLVASSSYSCIGSEYNSFKTVGIVMAIHKEEFCGHVSDDTDTSDIIIDADGKINPYSRVAEGFSFTDIVKLIDSTFLTDKLNKINIGHESNNIIEYTSDEDIDFEASNFKDIIATFGRYSQYERVGDFNLLAVAECLSEDGQMYFLNAKQSKEFGAMTQEHKLAIESITINDVNGNTCVFAIIMGDMKEKINNLGKSLTDTKKDDTIIIETKQKQEGVDKMNNNRIAMSFDGDLVVKRGNGDYVFLDGGRVNNIKNAVIPMQSAVLDVAKNDLRASDVILLGNNEYAFVKEITDSAIQIVNLDGSVSSIIEEISVGTSVPVFKKVVNPLDQTQIKNPMVAMSMLSQGALDPVAQMGLMNILGKQKTNDSDTKMAEAITTMNNNMNQMMGAISTLANAMTVLLPKEPVLNAEKKEVE